MNNSANKFNPILKITGGLSLLLLLSVPLWAQVGDPCGMLRYVMRLLIVVPLATALAIAAVMAFDRWTPGDWLEGITGDETHTNASRIACGMVVSALLLGVFWLCIQG